MCPQREVTISQHPATCCRVVIRTFEEHGRCPKLGACLCPRRSTLSHTYSVQQADSCSLINSDRVNRGREIARAIGALAVCALRSKLDSVGTRRLFRWLSKLPFIKGAPKRRHKLTRKIRKCTDSSICKLRLVWFLQDEKMSKNLLCVCFQN